MLEIHGIAFYRIIVQSDKKNPSELNDRISSFLENVVVDLLVTRDFQKLKNAVISKLREAPKSVWEESLRYWPKIVDWTYDFKSRLTLVDAIEKVSLADTVDFIKNLSKCCVSFQVYGNQYHNDNFNDIVARMDDYKRRSELYASQELSRLCIS